MFNLKQSRDSLHEYDNDMRPLSDVLSTVFNMYKPQFINLIEKNKTGFNTHRFQTEFEKFIVDVIPQVQKMLSPNYTGKVLKKYFSEHGQIAIIHDALKKIFTDEYDSLNHMGE